MLLKDCEALVVEVLERSWGCTLEEEIARDFEESAKAWHRFMAAKE